mgnify:CR=1 FL=1
MKTQICELINGSKNVIRDLSASKYAGCPAGTSAEFAGTTIRERAAAAEWCTITGRSPECLKIYKYETSFSFRVNADMTAEALIFARKSPGAMWKTRIYEYIDESFITIL